MRRHTLIEMILTALMAAHLILFMSGARAQTPVSALRVAVKGTLTVGTAGVALPSNLPVTLHMLRPLESGGTANITPYETRSDAEGAYTFADIPAQAGDLLFVSALFGGVRQSTALFNVQDDSQPFNVPLVIYEGTDDSSILTLVNARLVLDRQPGDMLQVLALYVFRNPADRFYRSAETTPDGRPVSVRIPLPIGAVGVAFDEPSRYEVGGTTMAPILYDTRPIMPGQAHEVVFSYQMPIEGGAAIDQDYLYATESLQILIPDDSGIRLTTDPGKPAFRSAPNLTRNPNRPYTEYTLESPLSAGARAIYTLELPTTPIQRVGGGEPGVFAAVLFALTALVVVAAGAVVIRRFMQRTP